MSTLFAFETAGQRLGLPADGLRALADAVRECYAGDEMLVELRMLRTLCAIEEGAITLDQATAEFTSQLRDSSDARA